LHETDFIQSSLRQISDRSRTTSASESFVNVFSIFASNVGSITRSNTASMPKNITGVQ